MADNSENFVMRGHKYLKKKHPLAYEAAQLFTPIGVSAAALEGIDAAKTGDMEELAKAALSAVPVSKAYRIGTRLAASAKEAAGAGSLAQKAKTILRKAGAGENVAEAGEAGWDQGQLAKEEFAKGGRVKGKKVKGWGIARGARNAKYL